MSAVMEGMSGSDFSYDSANNAINSYLRRNVFAFSAAKTFSEQKALSFIITNSDGTTKSFAQFRNAAQPMLKDFNENWLQTEYNNALASAQMAVKWNDFVDNMDVNGYLEYSTVGDSRVRPAHAALDGVTLRIDSPVWDRIYPPNDWSCRCTVVPGVASKAGNDADIGRQSKSLVTGYFDNHVGKTGIIFKEQDGAHPYFLNVKGKVDELHPVTNYDLKIPSKNLPVIKEHGSTEEYLDWWDDMHAKHGTGRNKDIALNDMFGNSIVFEAPKTGRKNSMFRDHILIKDDEDRYKYGHVLPDVLKQPDEIYSRVFENGLDTVYIKYFSNGPVMLIVSNDKKRIKGETMFMYSEKNAGEYSRRRMGVLLYAKK